MVSLSDEVNYLKPNLDAVLSEHILAYSDSMKNVLLMTRNLFTKYPDAVLYTNLVERIYLIAQKCAKEASGAKDKEWENFVFADKIVKDAEDVATKMKRKEELSSFGPLDIIFKPLRQYKEKETANIARHYQGLSEKLEELKEAKLALFSEKPADPKKNATTTSGSEVLLTNEAKKGPGVV
jgi:hypothetical protein